ARLAHHGRAMDRRRRRRALPGQARGSRPDRHLSGDRRAIGRDGYAVQRPYRGVFLTEAGEALAAASRERHRTVEAFLLALGVPADVARRDAEGIERHVSPETLAIFDRFTRQAG